MKKKEPIAKITPLKTKTEAALASREGLRESLRAKGAPLSEVVLASRKKESY
jgi:hypothetical protein